MMKNSLKLAAFLAASAVLAAPSFAAPAQEQTPAQVQAQTPAQVQAQTQAQDQAKPKAPREAEPLAFDPMTHKRVVEISEQLRCLVCQNQSIADSNAELAVDLRNQVIEQVKAGRTNKEIIDFMVERYGDFVLYKPPFKSSTLILWLGPIALLLIGLVAFYVNVRRRKQETQKVNRPLTPEEKARADKLLQGGE
jgi:cytochrome c-type biogenesis protein CcmH